MELFDLPAPAPRTPHVFSVSEVTRAVRTALEENVGLIWVEGEISNHRRQASGHQYFTLKDAASQLSCVLFQRPGHWRREVPMSDGMHVQARGTLTVYEARGQYQLNVQLVQAAGAGLLQARFEALKRKLDAEGLFNPARKRTLRRVPASIAIITSPTGAALRDMLNILVRRAPWIRILICPVRVQGEGAAEEIVAALEMLNRLDEAGIEKAEVIVVARGGGSAEDLWQFNEEILARAIVGSLIPVVSAVGHEIDFTIADFAADLRAPTPSAAAELIAPDFTELLRQVEQLTHRSKRCLTAALEQQKIRLIALKRDALFREPHRRLTEVAQRIDMARESLDENARRRIADQARRLAGLLGSLRQHRPDQLIGIRKQALATVKSTLAERFARALAARQRKVTRFAEMLRLLAPEATLARGYSITTLAGGKVVSSVAEISPGAKLITRLKDGVVKSTVRSRLK